MNTELNTERLREIARDAWPDSVKEIAEFIGDEAALNLFVRFAGRHLNVPKRAITGHVIEDTIGRDAFVRLAHAFGGSLLRFPGGHKLLITQRNHAIVKDFLQGMKQCDLATKYALTDRQINTIVNTTKL
jgi:Mor family transcriptional regulator